MNWKTLRLCFVGNMLGRNPGFVTTQGQIVADLLAAEGADVTCVSSKINRFRRLAEIVLTILKNHKRFDALVIEVYSGLGFIIADAAGRLGKFFNIPLILFLHGGNLPEFVRKHPRWAKSVFNRAASLIAPSSFLAEKLKVYGFRIAVIPNVVDLSLCPFRERSRIEPRLIWMRSFHPIYNPEMALKVFAGVRQSVPEATLTMAGVDKGFEKDIKKTAREMGLSDGVRFPGFLDAAAKKGEFAAANIYLNTNRIDNMPVSVVEACAFGLPVVATNVGGLPFLIENRRNGLLVADEDVQAMVEAVKELLGDAVLTRKISRAARQLAERCAWTWVCRDWANLFEEVLQRGDSKKQAVLPESEFPAVKLET